MRFYYKLFPLSQLKSQFIRKNRLFKRSSDFKIQLKERKKISFLYGNITRTQISRLVKQSLHFGKRNQTALFGLLESRLDVFLYRISFFDTIYSARFWIRNGRIDVNQRKMSLIDCKIGPGDIVTVGVPYRAELRDLLLSKWRLRFSSKKRLLTLSPFVLEGLVSSLLGKRECLPNNIINILRDQNLLRKLLRETPSLSLPSNKGLKQKTLPFEKVFTDYERSYLPPNLRDVNRYNYNSQPKGVLPLLLNYLFSETNFKSQPSSPFSKERKSSVGKPRKTRETDLPGNNFKAIHTEISFKTFSAIWLYFPQKLVFPSLVDGELVIRSLKKS